MRDRLQEPDRTLCRINSPYTDDELPVSPVASVTISGDDALELAAVLAEYHYAMVAEYNTDGVGDRGWVNKLVDLSGVDLSEDGLGDSE